MFHYKVAGLSPAPDFIKADSNIQLRTSKDGSFAFDASFPSEDGFEPFLELLRSKFAADLTIAIKPKNFAPKAIFFDMDGTMIEEETIVELARFAGKQEKVDQITVKAMNGELPFTEAFEQRVKLLQGLSTKIFQDVFESLTIRPFLYEFCQTAKKNNMKTYLVSGGFSEVAAKLTSKLGMDGYLANNLSHEDGFLDGGYTGAVVNGEKKRDFLIRVCKDHGWSTRDCVAVGDGANDKLMMRECSFAFGIRPKPVLYSYLHGMTHQNDFSFLKAFLFDC